MSEELFQLLLFAVIFVLLPTLDGMLRRRKQKRGDSLPEPEWEPDEGVPDGPGAPPTRPRTARSSEDLLPADLWEELRALARGERPSPTVEDVGPEEASLETEVAARPVPAPEAPYTASAPEPVVPRHARSGPVPPPVSPYLKPKRRPAPVPAEPAFRSRALETELEPFPEAGPSPIDHPGLARRRRSRGRSAASEPGPEPLLKGLRAMSESDLQRAVIFREVLGPPVAQRDEG